jgi:hypothetical protein
MNIIYPCNQSLPPRYEKKSQIIVYLYKLKKILAYFDLSYFGCCCLVFVWILLSLFWFVMFWYLSGSSLAYFGLSCFGICLDPPKTILVCHVLVFVWILLRLFWFVMFWYLSGSS